MATRYPAAMATRRSISSARNPPHNMAVRMKPFPRATVTSVSDNAFPGTTSSRCSVSGATMSGLPSRIEISRATVGKNANATAVAWRRGTGEKRLRRNLERDEDQDRRQHGSWNSSTKNEMYPNTPPRPMKTPVRIV